MENVFPLHASHPADVQVALVTGASRGIGRAIALELARLRYAVVVNYATRPDAAAAVVAEIVAAGGQAIAVQADVGSSEDRQRLIDDSLRGFGRLDVLINNAGITSVGRHDLLEATEASWDRVFDTNLKGPFFLSQLAARTMIGQIAAGKSVGGKLINISSVSAYAVSTNRADYCMTKAAMRMMTWLLAERLAQERIGVFEVCPGVIASDMTAPVKEKYDRLIAEGLWPIRRWGQPEDVARAVAAIVQDYFPFSTGECFNIDGGFHIRRL
jgi:NAD(P)-dependent dehydrogenase (short-subunit alcohol dehydrogenase family)